MRQRVPLPLSRTDKYETLSCPESRIHHHAAFNINFWCLFNRHERKRRLTASPRLSWWVAIWAEIKRVDIVLWMCVKLCCFLDIRLRSNQAYTRGTHVSIHLPTRNWPLFWVFFTFIYSKAAITGLFSTLFFFWRGEGLLPMSCFLSLKKKSKIM